MKQKEDKMKLPALIAIMIFVTISIYGQQKIKKLEVKEEGLNININFQPKIDEVILDNGLHIKVIPISADNLNTQFINESNFNGKLKYSKFKKSRNSFFLKNRKRKREKSDFEFLIEGASWLFDSDKISQQEYDELKRQIIFLYDSKQGQEPYNSDQFISSNPYYIGNKYLSVFKIKISNPTNSNLIFNEQIMLEYGNTILTPLSTNKIIEELKRNSLMNTDKVEILERHNLQGSFSIPPNSKFEKLVAFLPIDCNNDSIAISFSGGETKLKWECFKNKKKVNESYTFYEFEIKWYYGDFSSDPEVNFNI